MFFQFNEKKYTISEQAFDTVFVELFTMGVQLYQEQSQTKQLAAKMFARKMLSEMESKAPDLRETIRPKRGDDPVVHMAKIWGAFLKMAMVESNASIIVQSQTTEQGRAASITSLVFQPESSGEGGGQLVDFGQKRIRKDYLRKDASHTTQPIIS